MAGYGTDEGFEEYLDSNGYTLPGGAPSPAVLRQRGSAYLDGKYGDEFPGTPTAGFAQERAWPRTGASAYGQAIASDAIPAAVINASYAAAWYEANNAGGLAVAATPGAQIKRQRQKIDVIERETEYFEAAGDAAASALPVLSDVEGLLAPFLTLPEPAIFIV